MEGIELVKAAPGIGDDPHGSRGLKTVGGQILEEYQKELRSLRQRVAVFSEMSNHPIVGAALFVWETLLASITYRIEPREGMEQDARAVEIATRVNKSLLSMKTTFEDFMSEILTMLTYGFAAMEPTFRVDEDGFVSFDDIALRPAETIWEWLWEGDKLAGIRQQLTMTELKDTSPTVPIERLYLFRTSSIKNNPEGRSILRRAYEPYVRSKAHRDLEAIGHERDATGTPVVKVPKEVVEATADQAALYARKQNANAIARRLKTGQEIGLVLSSQIDPDSKTPLYDVSLLKAPGEKQFDAGSIIERYERQILFALLTDSILLGHEKTGAITAGGGGEEKDELLKIAINAMVDRILDVFNRRMIPDLCTFNGIPRDLWPEARAERLQKEITLAEFVKAIVDLSGAGMDLLPDDQVDNEVRARLRLPLKKANQEV